jgi:[acyl-carrier-protein] S-malonyltransferase
MQAYLFPGQGSQFPGMAKDLFERSAIAKALFAEADAVMGFAISDIMFNGTEEDLRRTDVTQPAIYIHSLVAAKLAENFAPEMVAGHSLGEFSALAAAGALSFADGLRLVKLRADAMQEACVSNPGTMAAILGLDDAVVEQVCAEITDLVVVPANYNCPGQLVISGSVEGVTLACEKLKAAGAKRCLMLPVGGAFHSPLMEPARQKLSKAIEETPLQAPVCPIYQNVDALPSTNPEVIKANLIAQLTAPVRWTQTVQNMAADGATHYTECGPGNVLQGLVKKIHKEAVTASQV